MNRIILIGNGFDLAHGLKTSYANFIDWYWEKRISELEKVIDDISNDGLCELKLIKGYSAFSVFFINYIKQKSTDKIIQEIYTTYDNKGSKALEPLENIAFGSANISDMLSMEEGKFDVTFGKLFEKIITKHKTKKWVDIENEYYQCLVSDKISPKELNIELDIIKGKLAEYLKEIQKENKTTAIDDLKYKIIEPLKSKDIAVGSYNIFKDVISSRLDYNDEKLNELIGYYSKYNNYSINHINDFKDKGGGIKDLERDCGYIYFPRELLLPDRIMILNFNYTDTTDKYVQNNDRIVVNHIHGSLDHPESMIFGYGDEKDETFKDLQKRNDRESLNNIKSIKYLEAQNYRELLAFIESAPYQIYLMGHSCGQSDGTLLNTLFEHKNCISIKPFYYKNGDSDNYMEIVQNISRNFTDMKLMRDRVVNKTQCEPMPQAE